MLFLFFLMGQISNVSHFETLLYLTTFRIKKNAIGSCFYISLCYGAFNNPQILLALCFPACFRDLLLNLLTNTCVPMVYSAKGFVELESLTIFLAAFIDTDSALSRTSCTTDRCFYTVDFKIGPSAYSSSSCRTCIDPIIVYTYHHLIQIFLSN